MTCLCLLRHHRENKVAFLVYKIERYGATVYVGVTTGSLAKRWREHRCAAKAGNECALYRAIRKYGDGAFGIVLVYEATSQAEMFAVEKGLIAQYGTHVRGGGYNLTLGGEGGAHQNHPKGADNHHSVMCEEIIAFIRDPQISGRCNRELRDDVENRFGIQVTRDGIRDARRGDSWVHLNAKYPPIKCGQGGRTSDIRSKSAIRNLELPHVKSAMIAKNASRLKVIKLAAKLTEKQVRSIYLDDRPNRVIEREYGMSHGIARQIKLRKTWASVTEGLHHG